MEQREFEEERERKKEREMERKMSLNRQARECKLVFFNPEAVSEFPPRARDKERFAMWLRVTRVKMITRVT